MPSEKPTAIVYIDGLSLFYRRLKGKNHLKWLDLEKLASLQFPEFEIKKVKYFTAIAKQLHGDMEIAIRQKIYLRALESVSFNLEIHQGYIRIDSVKLPKAPRELDSAGNLIIGRVYRLEEKETDVRIAMSITKDFLTNAATHYILISGDTDFEPLRELFVDSPNIFQRISPNTLGELILKSSQLPETQSLQKPRSWLT